MPFDVAPFQVPGEPGQATYTGGPPSAGLPPDLTNAVPDWVREVVRESGPLSPDDLPPEPPTAGATAGRSTHDIDTAPF